MTRRPALPDEPQILALQGHAVVTNDINLLALTWTALGRCSRYAYEPVTVGERMQAARGCADRLEMMQLTGETLRALPPQLELVEAEAHAQFNRKSA